MNLSTQPTPPQMATAPPPQPSAPPQELPPPPAMQMPQPSPPPNPPVGAVSPGVEVPVSYPAPNLPTDLTRATAPVEWSTGLCGCSSDLRSCCITFLCPCVTFGEISEIIDKGSSSCAVNGLIYGLLLALIGCACMYSFIYRTRMRKQFNLKGSTCGDSCIHFWCECCALCQEYRELKIKGFDMTLGWQANVERRNQGVMTTPPMQTGMRR